MTTHVPPPTYPEKFLVSVIIPVYNELNTIEEVLRRVQAVPVPKELIIVDDCSTDGTRDLLKKYENTPGIRLFWHERNQGKGGALRTALAHVRGSHTLIQDADLEYDPEDYPALVKPVLDNPEVTVVFGSRFMGKIEHMEFGNYWANRILTWFTNVLYGCRITDLCTAYKLYRSDVLSGMKINRTGFDAEHEMTAKLLRRHAVIVDVPVKYRARSVASGKKVRWTDFFLDVYTLVRYRFQD